MEEGGLAPQHIQSDTFRKAMYNEVEGLALCCGRWQESQN